MPSLLRLIQTPRGERSAMVGLLVVIVAGGWLCGDRMPVAEGFGWDGKDCGWGPAMLAILALHLPI